MNRFALYAAGVAALLVCAFAGAQEAADSSAQLVKEVRVEGLQRISEQLVRARLEVQAGQPYSQRAVARDIRRLYELGHFSAIKADAALADGQIVLTYIFEEKRVVDEIRIIGNDKIRTRNIRQVLSWREGDSFEEAVYAEERDAILKLYETKRFPNAQVDILVEEVAPSRVRVTYSIEEGGKARIRSVDFEGNTVVSDRKLRKLMRTRRSWWFLGGKYDEETFEDDLRKVVLEYHNYGRLEADIVGTDFEYDENGKRVDIVISLAEGPEYTVQSLETAGNEVFDDDEVQRLLEVQGGDIHNAGQVDADAELVQKGYEDSGYVNAQVIPQVTLDRERKTTNVVHRIEEGDLKYIREIRVTGNTVTRDDVIRRELLLNPGERFDGTLVQASERRLDNTQYFDTIRFTREPLAGDEMFENLLIDVDEGKTGNFDFGAGYSTEDKVTGFAELRLRNFDITNWPKFSGGGQEFRARIQLGSLRDQYSVSFTDPEFLGYPFSFGIDLYDESREFVSGLKYKEDTTGAQIRFGKMLSPYVTARTALRYSDIDVHDLPWYVAPDLRRQRGGSTTVSSVWGINRNTVDIVRDPTSGSVHDVEFELAGLGGDNHFYRIEHDSMWYYPLTSDNRWIFSYRTREGWINDYGDPGYVPITYRFFAGGSATVRGYKNREIGPKGRQFIFFGDEYRTGGELRLLQNLELKYKLTQNFRLYTFVDAGGIWATAGDFDFGDIKYSTGLGIGFFIPRMGPIRLDYGFPLNPDSDQGSGRLHLLTGLRF